MDYALENVGGVDFRKVEVDDVGLINVQTERRLFYRQQRWV